MAGLPDALDIIQVKGGVAGDEGNVLDMGLRDEQPVEGVAVVEGEIMGHA